MRANYFAGYEAGIMSDETRKSLPRTERDEAPMYLARYLERQTRKEAPEDGDETAPLYLRKFRDRRSRVSVTEAVPPLHERVGLDMQRAMSEDNRNKEISPPPRARKQIANEIYLVRHAETQGYSSESGITPLGTWQAHTYGHTMGKRVKSGETIVVRSAATNRAGQTAEQIHRGLVDSLAMFEKDVKVFEPEPMPEFRNFGVATPDGLRDVTAAFRKYYSVLEEFERTALGDRPMWLVEVDRFWRTQQGGADPIQHWLTIPMMHFEPPAMCVRRFWIGLQRLAADHPGARLVIATHSGPIRAFAIWAFGYDPGEPYNTEHVRVKLFEGGREALVSYRNRVQEVHVPEVESLPLWQIDEAWMPA
jgi:broad specificity phosphatase PhoE